MESYDEIISGAKLQRDRTERERAAAAAQQKELEERAAAEARGFLNAVILPEVEKARAALEAQGFPAEIGNGKGAEGVRCSLHLSRQGKNLVFTAGFQAKHGGGASPKISANNGNLDGIPVTLDQPAVEGMIRHFLTAAISNA